MDAEQADILWEYPNAGAVTALIDKLALDTLEAKDNLLAAKIVQAKFVNKHWGPELELKDSQHVMLSTKHR